MQKDIRIGLLIIGDEVLNGDTLDTNSNYAAKQLSAANMPVKRILTVGDKEPQIVKGLDYLFQECNIVISTGGLGPTRDDITKATVAKYYNTNLIQNEQILENLRERYKQRGRTLNELNLQQAMVPATAVIMPNDVGTAPIMWLEEEGKILATLPGVPFEMRHNLDVSIIPKLLSMKGDDKVVERIVMTVGIPESDLAIKLKEIDDAVDAANNDSYFYKLAYLPTLMVVKLHLTAIGPDETVLVDKLNGFVNKILDIANEFIYSTERISLFEYVGKRLIIEKKTIACVESCTGGYMAHQFTASEGSSAYFLGGAVTYDNQVKEDLVQVKHETLMKYGAVSEQTVAEMISGGLKQFKTDYVLATSGIAGPTGGGEDKPIGTLCFGIGSSDGRIITRTIRFNLRRNENIQLFSLVTVDLLRRELDKLPQKV
ncbi:MAG: CinA family nicotinamide mononucleotide deamidase-related protein [Bacteroidota bacterium]|nr:CinA family nicotinamide mononucleotide deamidase-related protein [Bacteroidota bacterium]